MEKDTTPTVAKPTETPNQPENVHHEAGGKKNMRMMYLIIGVVVLLVIAAGALAMQFKNSNKTSEMQTSDTTPIKIGILLPFSGGASGSGYDELKGIQLAKKQLEANNIELIQADSQCEEKAAEEAIKTLIKQQVIAIIGESCSNASLAALPEANKNKIVMMSPSASSPTLSISDDYFFRVVPPDTFQGKFAANLVYNKGIKTAALLYEDETYSEGLSKAFKQNFEALGGKIVADVTFETEALNMRSQISTIKLSKAEAVYLVTTAASTVTALTQAREAGITAPFFGGDATYDPQVITDGKQAAEGFSLTLFPSGTKDYKQAYINEYKTEKEGAFSAEAYDSFWALYLAIQKGARTGEEIKNILPSIKFDGASGHIEFDQNGEISHPNYKYEIIQIKNGEFVSTQ